MQSSRVACPLCHSERVHVLHVYEALLICSCEECGAQFSVSPDPYRQPTRPAAQPSADRRKRERRLGDRRRSSSSGKNGTTDTTIHPHT